MQGDAIHRLGRHFVALLLPFGAALCMGGCPSGGGGGGGGDNDPPPGAVTDTDDDGVRDEDDDCAATPSGATVDAQGCSPSQRDTDGDLVPNADDDCPDTPANTTVDARGCPVAGPGEGDADNDGVADSLDQCPATATDAEVNASGCAANQRDTDSDGVNDDADDCANTPTTVNVDENGCPVSAPGTPDTDGDGVNDDIDQCADTTAGADVDPNGCAVSQRDTDGDGVNDDADTCTDTAAGAQVDTNGCAASQRDTDGDGVFDDRDDCPDTAPRASVDENGCARGDDGTPGGGPGGTAECGNGTVETGEQCEPPNTATCDASCQNIGGGNSNNNCADATPVSEVALEISNVGATTDGPDHPGQCVLQDYTQVDADIWYCFTSPVTEQVIVSLCGSQFDTKVMVYNGCACPPGTPIACNDDQESVAFNCGTGTDSRVRFPATAQQSYLIRVGGFRGATGDGRLTIFRESDPTRGANACNAQAGACYTEHATPGCNDPASATVCQSTCAVDQFCCDTEWDAVCVSKADGIAHGFSACGAAQAGSCFSAHTAPGCSNESCLTDQPKSVCQAVCEVDPFCCLTEWDAVCVEEIGDECGVFSACRNGRGSCFSQHANAGCNVESCCNAVCDRDSACCNDVWDDVCATIATDLRASGQCR
ncbi:MAG: thrombospondin type 3 repeat-containing protein [Planctomycetes bacterium]|nr:thrombospondin type 3 repeat-containing protein [Planctomycetota bacterium]